MLLLFSIGLAALPLLLLAPIILLIQCGCCTKKKKTKLPQLPQEEEPPELSPPAQQKQGGAVQQQHQAMPRPSDDGTRTSKIYSGDINKIKGIQFNKSVHDKRPSVTESKSIAMQKEPEQQPKATLLGNIDLIMKKKPKGHLASSMTNQHTFDSQEGKIRRPKPGNEANINMDKHGNYLYIMSENASRTASISTNSVQEAFNKEEAPPNYPTTTTKVDEDQKQQKREEEPPHQQQQLSTVTATEDVNTEAEASYVSSKTV